MSAVQDVAEVRSWHWRQGSEDEPFCAFDAQDWPCSTARLLDRLERAERQVAAVRALADNLDQPSRDFAFAKRDAYEDAAHDLRAALATEETPT